LRAGRAKFEEKEKGIDEQLERRSEIQNQNSFAV